MPIILPPITRRKFVRHSIAIGGTAIMAPSHLASTVSEAVHLDQNRVALLSDTHISVDQIVSTRELNGQVLPSKIPSMSG